jgi:hypothetical protein
MRLPPALQPSAGLSPPLLSLLVDSPACLGYAYFASGRDRRGGALRTPSGPKGSSGKEVASGVAGKPARTLLILDEHEIY